MPLQPDGQGRLPGEKSGRAGSKTTKARSTRADVARFKAEILSLYEQGHTVADACRLTGKSAEIWDYYRRTDAAFKEAGDLITARRRGKNASGANKDISFEDFCVKYLGHRLFPHQMQWVDLIEGREPRDLHPGQTYHPGSSEHIVVNTPPGHGKSTTLTQDYVTYKIVTDPQFRVVIISKTETMAKKFLLGVKRRLTSPKFKNLIVDFAPAEGFEKAAEMWTHKMIYFGHTDSDQKDPNVEALGIGQQIYGARADLIILDDIEDVSNVHQWEDHMDYIMQDVLTRDARLFIVGTRVGPHDIYTELINPEHYDGEDSLWTYLSQPAVLEFAEDPKDWVTLWPRADSPHGRDPARWGEQDENGLWPKWDGKRLHALRGAVKPTTWSMVYMQTAVSDDSIFTVEAFNGCMSHRNRAVRLNLDHSYTIAGLDPATNKGYTACIVFQVDRRTGKRYLIDVFNKQVRAEGLRQLIFDFTEKYEINEWRIEKNAFQAFLTQDREINQFLASRGVRLREHHTGGYNKNDYEWGVSSLETLFRGYQDGAALLDLPSLNQNEAFKTLREQLVTWHPDHPKTQKIDLVMALWFTELGTRDIVKDIGQRKQTHLDNPFLSENDRMNRTVININEYLEQQRRGA
jgi:hypothetical protein